MKPYSYKYWISTTNLVSRPARTGDASSERAIGDNVLTVNQPLQLVIEVYKTCNSNGFQ